MHMLDKMTISATTRDVLAQLKKNREAHAAIVAEAREGYIDHAEKALQKRLSQLREGKLVSLAFNLSPPRDHTSAYDTAIGMVEMHMKPELTLDAATFRSLMMDEWDWKGHFLMANSAYSKLAADQSPANS